jgi:hypothetical protein
MSERAFKGVWICAAIWTDLRLSWIEKALLAEIDSLVSEEAPCYASNEHLANRVNVSVSRTNDMLARLQKEGFLVRVQYDGRTSHRVVNPDYSSNPETSKHWLSTRPSTIKPKVGKQISRKLEMRFPKNRKTKFLKLGNHVAEKQEGGIPEHRKRYIERMPEENTKRETTTTNPDLDSGKDSPKKIKDASSCFFSERGSSDSESKNNTALVELMVSEFGLNEKQNQTVIGYCHAYGTEYVRSKAEIVRTRPRRNAAGALLAALRDDWRPAVTTQPTESNVAEKKPGNRNIGNSNEYCDYSQYKSRA